MLPFISILAIIFLAQTDSVNETLQPYLLIMNDGRTLSVLLDPKDLAETRRPFIKVVLDEPWLSDSARKKTLTRLDINESAPVVSTTRKRRIREGWLENGGVEVDTPDGEVWIHGDEYELSQRANALADAGYQSPEQASAVQQESFVEEPEQHIAPGFWAQWRYHLTIVGVAAALIAAVAWATLFRGPWTALRS